MSEGRFQTETDTNPAAGLARIGATRPGATLVVEGVRSKAGWLGTKSFAQQLLDRGANEVLVFAPIPD
jgi:hypothetical protein